MQYGRVLKGYLAHKKLLPLGPYSRTMPKALRWSEGGVLFLMIEVPLYGMSGLV